MSDGGAGGPLAHASQADDETQLHDESDLHDGARLDRTLAGGEMVQMLVVRCADDVAELAGDALWGAGAEGIEERVIESGLVELRVPLGQVTEPEATELVTAARAAAAEHGWQVDVFAEVVTYTETWREHATVIDVDAQLRLVPAWRTPDIETSNVSMPDDGGVLEVVIEPAGSFGLGDHPTTQLCAGLVAERCRAARLSVLDVGCGSGVLAIIAAAYGAEPVVAIDVSPAAVAATEANAVRNGVGERVQASDTPIRDVSDELRVHGSERPGVDERHGVDERRGFELVVANVLAPALLAMAPDLVRLTRGELILSGLLAERYTHVVDALRPLVVSDVRRSGSWVAVVLTPPSGRLASTPAS